MLCRSISCVWGQRSPVCDIIRRRTNNEVYKGSHWIFVNLIFFTLSGQGQTSASLRISFFVFFVISFFIVMAAVEPPSPTYCHRTGCCGRGTHFSFPLLRIRSSDGSWYDHRLNLGHLCLRIRHALRKRLRARWQCLYRASWVARDLSTRFLHQRHKISLLTSFYFRFWYGGSRYLSQRTCKPETFRKYACSFSCLC